MIHAGGWVRSSCGVIAAVALSMTGCGHVDDAPVLVGGIGVGATTIDADPLALLPSGVPLLAYVDAAAMFGTSFGGDVARIAQALVPLGPASNFVPTRDVTRMFTGFYAMQGADFCAVVQGNFDIDRIRAAAEAKLASPGGRPLVKTRYAGQDVYTSGEIGFVALTRHTVISGNQTGIRRALDRLSTTRLERAVPPWMVSLMVTPGASFAMAADGTISSAGAAIPAELPMATGLRYVRALGNFKPPGMNVAGTITYDTVEHATAGTALLQSGPALPVLVGWIAGGMPQVKAEQADTDVGFTVALDDRLVRFGLGMLASRVGVR